MIADSPRKRNLPYGNEQSHTVMLNPSTTTRNDAMRYTTAIMLVLIIVHGPRARVVGAAETLQPNVIIILADDKY